MPGFIPWRKVDLLLRSQRTIWISTTRPDGRPHAVPVWYWWDGQAVYFATPRQSQKAKNLAQQPWVIVHAGDGDDVIRVYQDLLIGRPGIQPEPKVMQANADLHHHITRGVLPEPDRVFHNP